MCCELPTIYHQYKYNQRQKTALRHHYEYDYALRAERRKRFRQATLEFGLALKWFYEAGVKAVRAIGGIVRPRQGASGEVPG